MNELLKVLLSLSISGTLLMAVLLISRPLYKNKVSKTWQYYIWLIVIARFLVPFTPEANLMGKAFQQMERIIPATVGVEISGYHVINTATGNEKQNHGEETGGEENRGDAKPAVFTAQNIWAIWLFAASMLLIRKITAYQSFVKYIMAGRTEVTDMGQWEQLGNLLEQAGIKRTVSLYLNPLISSPLLVGFFRPCIMLPTEKLSDTDFKHTMMHELAHYKRGDLFYKWLVQITICIHWFNPAVWLLGREISKACELSCDEMVIRNFDERARRDYGNTLIQAVQTGGPYESPTASVTLAESVELLKERLDAIMRYEKTAKWRLCASFLLTAALVFGFIFSGAYAADSSGLMANNSPDIEVGGSYDGKTVYLVYTEKGLRSIGTEDYSLDGYYMQVKDIELSPGQWTPIGTATQPFTGTYNGNGCFIKGLTMTDPGVQAVGLFGYAQGAKLHNIELRDIDVLNVGSDIICAFPADASLFDNRVYQKVTANPGESASMEILDFRGKTYYLVFNEAQLRAIGTGDYGMDKNYMQQADIQLSTEEWVPIGTMEQPFTGSYNGNGFEIKGLTMTDPNTSVIGMFGVAEGAHIYNITLRDYDIMSAGKNAAGKSIAPILVFGLGGTRSYDNFVYPKK